MILLDSFSCKNQRFLVRVDFNVPMDSKLNITDDTRIRASLLTINKIISFGGAVVLISHIGRPKGYNSSLSMRHLVNHLSDLLNSDVKYIDQCVGKCCADDQIIEKWEVLLLENLRFHDEKL